MLFCEITNIIMEFKIKELEHKDAKLIVEYWYNFW